MSSGDKTGWQGMRTVAQIRKDRGLEIPLNKDSLYKVTVTISLRKISITLHCQRYMFLFPLANRENAQTI